MTQLFVYDELKQLVSIIKERKAATHSTIDIKECVNQIKPVISLNSYISRFIKDGSSDFKWSQEPLDEFCMLVSIYLEKNNGDNITSIEIKEETLSKVTKWFQVNLPRFKINAKFKDLFKAQN
jgi:hypothetical protein